MKLRNAIGGALRERRVCQHRTLRDVSRDARVSLGYLSEIETGKKEISSELLASLCVALDVELADLLMEASTALRGDRPAILEVA
jgi:transcriptional regulator with XRE-family HTH domain